MSLQLDENSITFGKYKGLTLKELLRDRKYCKWLLEQKWFQQQYEFLYNKIKQHKPETYFIPEKFLSQQSIPNFVDDYKYFNFLPLNELKIELTENEKICYKYYTKIIDTIKSKLQENISDCVSNPYDVKTPSSWLIKFEKKYSISRDIFKEFLIANDLPTITSIIEDVKKQGNIEYKTNKSYKIAQTNSKEQEKFWENLLKQYYSEDIYVQYKYLNCFFDFLNIKTNTLYECKLSLKDFDKDQYNKYSSIMNTYNIIYLIGYDCVLCMKNKILYTTNTEKYRNYFFSIDSNDFKIKGINNINEYFTK